MPLLDDPVLAAELLFPGARGVGPGRRFLERSSMLTMSLWQHERTVEAEAGGAQVTDRLGFELRRPLRWIPGSGALAARIVAFLFRHRHRRLAAHYESPA